MAERKTIATISVVTDSETSYDNIGDIDGSFSEDALRSQIESYGPDKLCNHLAYLQWQVWDMVRRINSEKNNDGIACKSQ